MRYRKETSTFMPGYPWARHSAAPLQMPKDGGLVLRLGRYDCNWSGWAGCCWNRAYMLSKWLSYILKPQSHSSGSSENQPVVTVCEVLNVKSKFCRNQSIDMQTDYWNVAIFLLSILKDLLWFSFAEHFPSVINVLKVIKTTGVQSVGRFRCWTCDQSWDNLCLMYQSTVISA